MAPFYSLLKLNQSFLHPDLIMLFPSIPDLLDEKNLRSLTPTDLDDPCPAYFVPLIIQQMLIEHLFYAKAWVYSSYQIVSNLALMELTF